MKDWRSEIANIIRTRCHAIDSHSSIISGGCPQCQETFRRVLAVIDEELIEVTAAITEFGADPALVLAEFQRSLPNVR